MNEIIEQYDAPKASVYAEKTAGFWMRFWAFLIDLLVISAVTGLTIRPIFAVMDWDMSGTNWYAPFVVLSAVVYYAYFVLLTKFLKQTLGKMIFGLRVEKENGEALDWGTVLFRELIGRFIQKTFFFLPCVIVAFTPQNKGVADFFADTIVVHEKIYEKQV
ncbi:MAG: RDD family protein [Solibacillus sp.]